MSGGASSLAGIVMRHFQRELEDALRAAFGELLGDTSLSRFTVQLGSPARQDRNPPRRRSNRIAMITPAAAHHTEREVRQGKRPPHVGRASYVESPTKPTAEIG